MSRVVEVSKLDPETPFRYRGRVGVVKAQGQGSTTVRVQKPVISVREFTPQTGPKAGITVRFDMEYEVVTWAKSSPVEVD